MSAQAMRVERRERRGDDCALAPQAYVSVARLGPLECDIRAVQALAGHEAAVELAAFLLKHPDRHIDAGVAELLYATAADAGEGVYAARHHALHPEAAQHVGTGRRAAVVGARLEAHIDGAAAEERLVTHAPDGVDLCVRPAAVDVIALADDAPVAHYHGADHWVGRRSTEPSARQFQAAAHILFVC